MFITVIIFLIMLSVLVFSHELGHFFFARRFGVKAPEFCIGFHPRLFGFYRDKNKKWKIAWGSKKIPEIPGTLYSLGLIPIGGFVNIKGENGDEETLKEKDSFASKPIWQKSIIVSAGVGMNLLLAAILISIGFMLGLPQDLSQINKDSKAVINDAKIQITEVLKDSPADKAKLLLGDEIVSIDNQEFKTEKELQNFTSSNIGKELNYLIKRGSEELVISIKPEILKETKKGGIGIAITQTGIVQYPWYLAIIEGVKATALYTWMIILAFIGIIKHLILGESTGAQLTGPIGIAKLTGQMANLGFVYLLQFTAILSMNLAVINFLPIPALDGGRFVFLMLEKLRGKPIKRELEAKIHYVGMTLLMLLMAFVIIKDIIN